MVDRVANANYTAQGGTYERERCGENPKGWLALPCDASLDGLAQASRLARFHEQHQGDGIEIVAPETPGGCWRALIRRRNGGNPLRPS